MALALLRICDRPAGAAARRPSRREPGQRKKKIWALDIGPWMIVGTIPPWLISGPSSQRARLHVWTYCERNLPGGRLGSVAVVEREALFFYAGETDWRFARGHSSMRAKPLALENWRTCYARASPGTCFGRRISDEVFLMRLSCCKGGGSSCLVGHFDSRRRIRRKGRDPTDPNFTILF